MLVSSFMNRNRKTAVEKHGEATLAVMRSLGRFRIVCTTSNGYRLFPSKNGKLDPRSKGCLVAVDENGEDVGKPVAAREVQSCANEFTLPGGPIKALGGRPIVYECTSSTVANVKFVPLAHAATVSCRAGQSLANAKKILAANKLPKKQHKDYVAGKFDDSRVVKISQKDVEALVKTLKNKNKNKKGN